jgi:hypothetical protein
MQTLIVLNLIATLVLLVLVGRQQLRPKKMTREAFEKALEAAAYGLAEVRDYYEAEKQRNQSRPIRHEPVQGPLSAKATNGMGYWRPKDDPTAEPFLAAWYETDTTCAGLNGFDGSLDEGIPADTYIDFMGRKLPGPKFRAMFEPAPMVMEVAKFKPKAPLRNSTLVQSKKSGVPLSEEEEAALVAEYDLGGHVTDRPPV